MENAHQVGGLLGKTPYPDENNWEILKRMPLEVSSFILGRFAPADRSHVAMMNLLLQEFKKLPKKLPKVKKYAKAKKIRLKK